MALYRGASSELAQCGALPILTGLLRSLHALQMRGIFVSTLFALLLSGAAIASAADIKTAYDLLSSCTSHQPARVADCDALIGRVANESALVAFNTPAIELRQLVIRYMRRARGGKSFLEGFTAEQAVNAALRDANDDSF